MWPPESSGTWAEWIAGLATAAALVFALVQLGIDRIDKRRERHERLAEERSEQARAINAWYVTDDLTGTEFVGRMLVAEYVYIRNASHDVVYDLIVSYSHFRTVRTEYEAYG